MPSKKQPSSAAATAPVSSIEIAPDLFLVRQVVTEPDPGAPPVPATPPAKNHFWVTDVSGSMYDALPKMIAHLSARVRDCVNIGDTVTCAYFSGRSQCGVFIDTVEVKDLSTFTMLTDAFRKWLRTIGLTGFKRPLQLVAEKAAEIAKKHPGAIDLVFLSDGCETEGDRTADILDAAKHAGAVISSATVVRYGWWADEVMLGKIAEQLGGCMVTADDFSKFTTIFEETVKRRGPGGGKKKVVTLPVAPVDGFAFALDGGLAAFATDAGRVAVPESATSLYYLSTSPVGHHETTTLAGLSAAVAPHSPVPPTAAALSGSPMLSGAYAAVALFSQRLRSDTVLKVLSAVGDVALIDTFARCFGKQAFAAYYEMAERAALDTTTRWAKGWDPKRVPAEDAFTVLDLLVLLSKDKGTRLVIDHPDWKYNAISRRRLDASTVITPDEVTAIKAAAAEDGADGLEWLRAIEDKIAEVRASKATPPKFTKLVPKDGYPISDIAWNSGRPNASLRIVRRGSVFFAERLTTARSDLAKAAAEAHAKGDTEAEQKANALLAQLANVPTSIMSQEIRQYAVVSDGIINVPVLPLIVSEAAWKVLHREGLVTGVWKAGEVVSVDIRSLPVINRRMVREVSAAKMFSSAFALESIGALRKVYKFYLDEVFPKAERSALAEQYGSEAAVWLKEEIGITDGGYAPPHTTQAPATDRVVAREFDIAVPGLSSLPKVMDAIAKLGPKAPIAVRLMAPALAKVRAFCKREGLDYKNVAGLRGAAAAKLALLKNLLADEMGLLDDEYARLMAESAQYAFILIVGQKWPNEWGSNMGDIAAEQAKEAANKAAGKDVKKRIAAKGSLKITVPVPVADPDSDRSTTAQQDIEIDLRMYEVDVLL